MNIVLHGAINGTNFGDCLFADMFYKKLTESRPEDSVYFYDIGPFGISDYLRSHIGYTKKMKLSQYRKMDVLVYISGGYFGEGKKSMLRAIQRFLRYFLLGLYAKRINAKICIVGVEVGPIHYGWLRKVIGSICRKSSLFIVRNQESADYCKEKNLPIPVLSVDTAISVRDYCLEQKRTDAVKKISMEKGKKIFLHVSQGEKITDEYYEKILKPIVEFVTENGPYTIVVGNDGVKENPDILKVIEYLHNNNVSAIRFCYGNYWEFCSLISEMDTLITRKLHVGIIGSTYGKSVISLPAHEYKTKRFYRQIGEADRCVNYDKLDGKQMKEMLQRYANVPIQLDEAIYNQASGNIEKLLATLQEMDAENRN